MNKFWVMYHLSAVFILLVLIISNMVINAGRSEHDLVIFFTGAAIYLSGFHILVFMPIWLIVLLLTKKKIDRKSFWSGIGLFLLFLGLTSVPVITVIGYMAF